MTTRKTLTLKQIRQELTMLGVKIPTKGSGSTGGIVKSDLFKLLEEEKIKKEDLEFKKRLSKYKLGDLNKEMRHLDIIKPKLGSGKGGRVVKSDLLRLIEEKKELANHTRLPEGVFFKNMPVGLARKVLVGMDLKHVLKFCRVNKYSRNTVCNENFWAYFVTSKKDPKYLTKDKGSYDTWREFAIKEKPYGPCDLHDIGKKVKLGLMTEQEAKIFIRANYEEISYKGSVWYYIQLLRDNKNDSILDDMNSPPNSFDSGSGSDDDGDYGGYDSHGDTSEEIEIEEPYKFYYNYVKDEISDVGGENIILIYESDWDGNIIHKGI